MIPEEKRTLSTGKVVEDELFKLGKRCKFEHPCHSWILDTTDEIYTLEGHFTKEELKEIDAYKPAILQDIPDDVAEYMRTLNASTTNELREQCLNCPWSEPFNRDKDFDLDWVFGTMLMMIREYESGNLETSHHELWYMLRTLSRRNVRLLNTFTRKETSQDPITELQNEQSRRKCIDTWQRLICYWDRVVEQGYLRNTLF